MSEVQALWIGGSVSPMQRMCINSYLAHGHSFVLYAYDDIAGLPSGATIKDAADILPRETIRQYKWKDSVAPFSDYFRYRLLHERGGIWTDTDVVCLNALPVMGEYFFFDSAAPHIIKPDEQVTGSLYPNNWFVRAPAGSPVMDYCVRKARKRAGNLPEFSTLFFTFQKAVKRFDLHRFADSSFFPVNWNAMHLYRDASEESERLWREYGSRAPVAHLCNHMWIFDNVDRDKGFARGSIYDRLMSTYG